MMASEYAAKILRLSNSGLVLTERQEQFIDSYKVQYPTPRSNHREVILETSIWAQHYPPEDWPTIRLPTSVPKQYLQYFASKHEEPSIQRASNYVTVTEWLTAAEKGNAFFRKVSGPFGHPAGRSIISFGFDVPDQIFLEHCEMARLRAYLLWYLKRVEASGTQQSLLGAADPYLISAWISRISPKSRTSTQARLVAVISDQIKERMFEGFDDEARSWLEQESIGTGRLWSAATLAATTRRQNLRRIKNRRIGIRQIHQSLELWQKDFSPAGLGYEISGPRSPKRLGPVSRSLEAVKVWSASEIDNDYVAKFAGIARAAELTDRQKQIISGFRDKHPDPAGITQTILDISVWAQQYPFTDWPLIRDCLPMTLQYLQYCGTKFNPPSVKKALNFGTLNEWAQRQRLGRSVDTIAQDLGHRYPKPVLLLGFNEPDQKFLYTERLLQLSDYLEWYGKWLEHTPNPLTLNEAADCFLIAEWLSRPGISQSERSLSQAKVIDALKPIILRRLTAGLDSEATQWLKSHFDDTSQTVWPVSLLTETARRQNHELFKQGALTRNEIHAALPEWQDLKWLGTSNPQVEKLSQTRVMTTLTGEGDQFKPG